MPEGRQRLAAVLATALPVLVVSRLAGWWPCDVGCQGGGFYKQLAGIDTLWLALGAYALLALLAWWRPNHALTRAFAGLCAGSSLFFLALSAVLPLFCPFCLTVHALVCTSAVLLGAWEWRWLVLGLLAIIALFHHGPVRDVITPVAQVAAPSDALSLRMDAHRSRGPVDAVQQLEVVLDLQCAHCAESWSGLAAVIGPAVRDGRLRLTVRLVVRPSQPASRDLARWAFAAAADSAAAHGRYLVTFLGTRTDLTTDEVRSAHAEDLAPILAAAAAHGPVIEALVEADQALISRLGLRGATPLLVLSGAGRELGRWSGSAATPEALAAALHSSRE